MMTKCVMTKCVMTKPMCDVCYSFPDELRTIVIFNDCRFSVMTFSVMTKCVMSGITQCVMSDRVFRISHMPFTVFSAFFLHEGKIVNDCHLLIVSVMTIPVMTKPNL